MNLPPNPDRRSLLTAGVEHFQAGDLEAAEGLFRKLLAGDPDDPDALHLLALTRHQAGDNSEAIGLLEKAVRKAGDNEDFLANLGQIYQAADRNLDAIGCFRRVLEINPRNVEVLNTLGGALIDERRFAEAADGLRRALALVPNHRQAAGNLGVALYGLGRADEALDGFRQVLAAEPNDAIALAAMGAILFERQEFDEAGRCLTEAAAIDPRFDYGAVCHFGDAFPAHTDPDRFADTLSALPAVTGTMPKSSGAGPIVMSSCDHGYFRRFGRALALSVDRFAPGHDLHLHVINPEPSFADEVRALGEELNDTVLTVSTETAPGAGTLYYPVVRFVRLASILEETGRDILHLDADSLVQGPLASVGEIDAGADLSIPMRFEDFALKYKVLISTLFVRDTPAARRFMRRYACYLGHCIAKGTLVWCLDQTAFYIVYRQMEFEGVGVALAPLPAGLCDHGLDPRSDVWAAKGDIKENKAFAKASAELLGDGG